MVFETKKEPAFFEGTTGFHFSRGFPEENLQKLRFC